MSWQPEQTRESGIVRVEGVPNSPERPGEKTRWRRFRDFVCPWLSKGARLGDAYAEAKLAQEENTGKRIAAEAAEVAAREEAQKLENVKAHNAIVDDIFADDGLPEQAKALKLAKLAETDSELAGQVAKIKDMLETLSLTKGLSLDAGRGETDQ